MVDNGHDGDDGDDDDDDDDDDAEDDDDANEDDDDGGDEDEDLRTATDELFVKRQCQGKVLIEELRNVISF